MTLRPALIALALLTPLTGCETAGNMLSQASALTGAVVGAESDTLHLSQLDGSFSAFEGAQGYDFLAGGGVTYHALGVEKYDRVFLASAQLTANLVQIRGAVDALRSGQLSFAEPGDVEFLQSMLGHAAATLPTLFQDARTVASQLGALRPHQELSGMDVARALVGIDQTRQNLALLVSADYRSLASGLGEAHEGVVGAGGSVSGVDPSLWGDSADWANDDPSDLAASTEPNDVDLPRASEGDRTDPRQLDRRGQITWVQARLNQLGFACGSPDGVAGTNTRRCVQAYQSSRGAPVTGTVDEALIGLIMTDVDS